MKVHYHSDFGPLEKFRSAVIISNNSFVKNIQKFFFQNFMDSFEKLFAKFFEFEGGLEVGRAENKPLYFYGGR